VLNNASPSEPFRQIRLAKWAQDLQRSLEKERRRYQQKFYMPGADSDPNSLPLTTLGAERPEKGRLGGPISIIDPRDPLGVLAFGQTFRRRGYFALQIAGSCGLIGAAAWWVLRNWADVQEFFGFGTSSSGDLVSVTAIPAPTPTRSWSDFGGWRDWIGGTKYF
jgi:hypothetical protein